MLPSRNTPLSNRLGVSWRRRGYRGLSNLLNVVPSVGNMLTRPSRLLLPTWSERDPRMHGRVPYCSADKACQQWLPETDASNMLFIIIIIMLHFFKTTELLEKC